MGQDTSSPAYMWARQQEKRVADDAEKAEAELFRLKRDADKYRALVASGKIKED